MWTSTEMRESQPECVCMKCTVFSIGEFFSSGAGLFSRSRLRGTQGGAYTLLLYVLVLAPAGLRCACSGRSKSTELALFRGIAFGDAEPPRTM